MIRKTEENICPECGCAELAQRSVSDLYGDTVLIECWCMNCEAIWWEEYKLDYRGYSYCGKSYDIQGAEN